MYSGQSYYSSAALLLFAIFFCSCKKEWTAGAVGPAPEVIHLPVPGNFPAIADEQANPLTAAGIALGRKLFYEVRLSGNNRISCASCHRQDLAFTDGLALSNTGVSGMTMPRHAPALFNLAWANRGFFWDGGAKNLESQAFGPLTSADEMSQNLLEMERELKQVPAYTNLFKAAFGEEISASNVVKALAQFQRTLISADTRYDQFRRNENGVTLSPVEMEGMKLVDSKCKGCHSGELFTDGTYHNNGLDKDFSEDHEGIYQGRFRVSHERADMGSFKTPSLRNVMLTAPYMHDGRFTTIDQVLSHYDAGIQDSPFTDPLLRENQGRFGIPLSAADRLAIKAFLATLTDHKFIKNKNISDPNE